MSQSGRDKDLLGLHAVTFGQFEAKRACLVVRILAAVGQYRLHGSDRDWRRSKRVLVRIQLDQRSQMWELLDCASMWARASQFSDAIPVISLQISIASLPEASNSEIFLGAHPAAEVRNALA